VQYRLGATGTATTVNTTSATLTVNGLTPDATYQWRARARIGTYISPYSDWTAVPQPSPNTYPGKFFSGSTADTVDIDYGWDATAQNSTSYGLGPAPVGWLTFAQGDPGGIVGGSVARASASLFGPYAVKVSFWQDQTGPGFTAGTSFDIAQAAKVEEDGYYTGSISVLFRRANRARARLAWISAAGAFLGYAEGAGQAIPVDTITRLSVGGVAPTGAEYAAVWWVTEAGTGYTNWLGGDSVIMDGAMITLGSVLFPYFDGDSASTPGFDFAWVDDVINGVSVRLTVPVDEVDPLADPDCPAMPPPPLPPEIETDCITETGTWRRYTLTIPATEVPAWSEVIPSVTLATGASEERQVRIRFFENPDNLLVTMLDDTSWTAELILTYIPPTTAITLDGMTERVRAEVAGRAPVPANHLLQGTRGAPAVWPVLSCGISYIVAIDVPPEAPSGNLVAGLQLTGRMS
jgi:hypothetical protein